MVCSNNWLSLPAAHLPYKHESGIRSSHVNLAKTVKKHIFQNVGLVLSKGPKCCMVQAPVPFEVHFSFIFQVLVEFLFFLSVH